MTNIPLGKKQKLGRASHGAGLGLCLAGAEGGWLDWAGVGWAVGWGWAGQGPGARAGLGRAEAAQLKSNSPGHRLLILINILEINQYFWFSKNIDFCIDLAIDLGIDFETATFDQI